MFFFSRVQYAYLKGGKIANLSYDTGDGKINSYVYTYAKDGLPEKSEVLLPSAYVVPVWVPLFGA